MKDCYTNALSSLVITSGVLASAWTTAVMAQDDVLYLEEIVVTARKMEENLQDVPISITAFSAEDISNHGFTQLDQIETLVPNFKMNIGQGYTGTTSFNIRGVSSRDASIGFESTTGAILDDVFIGRSAGFDSSLLDLERIEVLRGPQGTLQGRNLVGGAINMVTSKPSDEFGGKFKASYGRFNTYKMSGYVTGPLKEGVLAGKIALSHGDSDGPAYNVTLDEDIGGIENKSVRAQLRYTPNDQLEVLLTGDYSDDQAIDLGLDAVLDASLTSASPELLDRRYFGDFLNTTDRDIYGVAANVYYELANGMSIASITSHRGFELDTQLDQDNGAQFSGDPGAAVHSRARRDQTQTSQELRLHSAPGEDLSWLLGLYYFREDLDTDGASLQAPFIPGVGLLGPFSKSDATITTRSMAIFGSMNYNFTEKLSATLGIRYDDSDREIDLLEVQFFDGVVQLPGFPAPFPFINAGPDNIFPTEFVITSPFPLTNNELTDREFSGDITLTYQWNDDVSTYARYARGFKGGGFNSQFSFGLGGGSVEPEFVDSYELGLRSYLLDRRVRFNATVFYLSYTDQQVAQFIVTPSGFNFVTFNAPETESYGAEIELVARLSESLTLNGSVGLLDTEFTEGAGNIIEGNIPPDSPEFTVSASLQYQHPLNDAIDFFSLFEVSHSDDYFTVQDNHPIGAQDAYTMINARLGIQSSDDTWSLRVYGRNLLDEDIVTTGFSVPPAGKSLYTLGNPVTYGVEAIYNF